MTLSTPRMRGRRGTARNPGSDLAQLPIGLDLSGISLTEGLRAALATGAFLLLHLWFDMPLLLIAGAGAMITCFCDIGGTLRQRIPMLLIFTFLGAVCWAAFGMVHALGLPATIAILTPAIFLLSMARVWGLRAQTVGNILIVVVALAVDEPLGPTQAMMVAAAFIVGGLWACSLTLLIWRVQPDRPAARAVSQAFDALSALSADLRRLCLADASTADWEAHARAHRRAVRAQIETARGLVAGSVSGRGLVSGRAQKLAMMLEAADQVFGELIVLSEMLEGAHEAAVRMDAERLLRRIRPILRVLGTDRREDRARMNASLDRAIAGIGDGPVGGLSRLLVDRLRVVVRIAEAPERPRSGLFTAAPAPRLWRDRILGPLRDELTWRSAILRHAVRATLLTAPAAAISLIWWTPYSHWLSITVALTMQPFFAATWQRALERIGGTALGALLGGALAFLPSSPVAMFAALIVLSVIGFSARQVSYGAYIACLTPLVVVFFDIAAPGHSPWVVAGMRVLYTLIGGLVAVSACLLLWPSWEPDRLRTELRGTLTAYARLAAAILADPTAERAEATEAARRAAGLANSNLEASLSRALQEPGVRHQAELVKLIAADAILRRLGGTLLAVPHDPSIRTILDGASRRAWQTYLEGAFLALAEGAPGPREAPQDAPAASTLQRAARAIRVLSADLLSTQAGGATKGSPSLSRS